MEACHEDGKCWDDRLENLRWDTHSANLMDRVRHGTAIRGEQVNTAKLTAPQVTEIRIRRQHGEKLKSLAEEFGVSETMISLIVRRRNWQHVS